MANVVVLESVNEDLFVCGVCKLVYNSLQMFLEHKQLHCAKGTDYIGTRGENFLATNPVINREHGTSDIPEVVTNDIICTVCNKKFKKVKCLHAYVKSHEKPSQCPICGRCFENNSHLKRHLNTHKVWPEGLNETTAKSPNVELSSYSCSYCESVLSNYSQFRAHLSNHLSLKKFKCIQHECNGFYNTVDDLLRHVSTVHSVQIYTCHKCRKPFHSLDAIANHQCQDDNTQSDKFKCSLCDATFRKSEKLSLHMLTENHSKACVHCSKTFASDKRLRMHLQIHKQSKPHQCNICGSRFQLKKYLSSHLLKHGERQFTCSVCKQTFKRQDVLQRHVKTHQLRKHFKCPFKDVCDCTKEFSRSDKLKQHIKSHTKHMKPTKTKSDDAGTIEICIVPLDADID